MLYLGLALWACGCDESSHGGATPVHSTLPNGGVKVAHFGVEHTPEYHLVEEVRIGAVDGPDEHTFGEIRAVAADLQGRIHILDFQSQLIRTFSPSGSFVRQTARRGAGPAEIEDANGLMVDRSGTLWVNDPGNGRVIAIDTSGVQRATHVRQVLQHRFVWSGGIDSVGRVWDHVIHHPPGEGRPDAGAYEFQRLIYGKGFDTHDISRVDSVLLVDGRGAAIAAPGMIARIPFQPQPLVEFDMAGGFWVSDGAAYEIAHISVAGDTSLLISNQVAPVPVTDAQLDSAVSRLERFLNRAGPADIDFSVIPEAHPTIIQLIPEWSGGVWVRRPTPDGTFLADKYARTGAYEGTVSSTLNVSQHHRTVANGDVLHVVSADTLGVQYAVRVRAVHSSR